MYIGCCFFCVAVYVVMVSFCQLSNLMGIFPVVYCLQHGLYWVALILTVTVTLSLMYHHDESNRVALVADMCGCALLVGAGVYILLNSDEVLTWSNLLTLVFASGAVTSYLAAGDDTESEEYMVYHTGWHVLAFYGIATFLYSYVNTTYRPTLREESRFLAKSVRPALGRLLPVRLLSVRRRRKKESDWARIAEDGAELSLDGGSLNVLRANESHKVGDQHMRVLVPAVA